ncbi:peptidase S15 [Rhodobacteraceae bacterium WD3A24]|nr:peptidase S15 [Rhodobacteraceae bacterium WD3A24]
MEIEHEQPIPVTEIEHTEITMTDGCRLAARIWMPEGAEDAPVPAIFEYIPYRKNDKTLERDFPRARYMSARGYAYVRVDLRGTGESEGVMPDEYLPRELEDGREVISWIADQPWCDGNVGMVGISWGGFNGLQIAALQPPALKAIVTICSTDDRYADDVHYMGGTMLIDQLSWAAVMFGINSLPPDPTHVGDRWRDMWMKRLKGSGLWLKNWLEHQTRDDFWKHGSICEDYAAVQIPVYAVSGWADGYCRTVFRLMENLAGPRKGIVGPWAHRYPHLGEPGPAIDWLGEELRWWDRWLKGDENGIMDEPQLTLYMQDHARPQGYYTHREGRWITEPAWPSPNIARTAFALGSDGRLAPEEDDDLPDAALTIASPLWVGLGGGKWCSYANPGDLPVDQRRDDAGSLVFETAPLAEPFEMAGDPDLTLCFSVDRPVALVAARLVDVAPNGAATRVSYGLLNLTHRDSHETPEALTPGEIYTVQVPFKHVAQTFRAGHRIRLSLSTNYFPLCWPAPEAVTMTVYPARCRFGLPARREADQPQPRFGPPRAATPLELVTDQPPAYEWQVVEDRSTGRFRVEILEHQGTSAIPAQGLTITSEGREIYEFDDHDHHSPRNRISWTHEFSRGDWHIRTLSDTEFWATPENFVIRARLRAWETGRLVHEEDWDETIPRRLV